MYVISNDIYTSLRRCNAPKAAMGARQTAKGILDSTRHEYNAQKRPDKQKDTFKTVKGIFSDRGAETEAVRNHELNTR